MTRAQDLKQNHLLNALSPAGRKRVQPQLEFVKLPFSKRLFEPGDTLQHAYFPTDSVVALLNVMEDGASSELAVVGNEGVVGVSLFLGGESSTSRATVQNGGRAYRLAGRQLKQEFGRNGEMQRLLLRYT